MAQEARPTLDLQHLVDDFDTVIITAPDPHGRMFGRRVSSESFGRVVAEGGIGVSTCVYGWDIAQDASLLIAGSLAYTGVQTGMGDFLLRPDLSTLRPAGWLDRTAICIGDSIEESGLPTSVAPRSILKDELFRWSTAGISASAGTELEFYLYRGSPRAARAAGYSDLVPTTESPADYSIYEGDEFDSFFADLRGRLDRSGLKLEASQGEWGLGQWETTLQHGEPLEMADRHALFKLATRSFAARHDMSATFMAKPFDGGPGSSCHVHVSVRNTDGAPLFWDDTRGGTSDSLRWAVGGALANAGGLMALYAPTVNSYRRIRGQDAAGWGLTWGFDHRFVTARVIGHTPDSVRLEFRLPGADANPYLVLAGVLASIRTGMEDQVDPGEPTVGDPFGAPATGIPQNLGEAVTAFRSCALAIETMGAEVVDHYATLMQREWDVFLDSVTDWDRRRYFELI